MSVYEEGSDFFHLININCTIAVCDRHGYTVRTSNQLMSFNGHKKSCRRVRFNADGSHLVTASKDKSLQVIDMGTGSVTTRIKAAHECVCPLLLVLIVRLVIEFKVIIEDVND